MNRLLIIAIALALPLAAQAGAPKCAQKMIGKTYSGEFRGKMHKSDRKSWRCNIKPYDWMNGHLAFDGRCSGGLWVHGGVKLGGKCQVRGGNWIAGTWAEMIPIYSGRANKRVLELGLSKRRAFKGR